MDEISICGVSLSKFPVKIPLQVAPVLVKHISCKPALIIYSIAVQIVMLSVIGAVGRSSDLHENPRANLLREIGQCLKFCVIIIFALCPE